MLEDVPAIEVNASGDGQCYKRPLHGDGVGSNSQGKEDSGQQGCEYHDCSTTWAQ